MKYGASFNCYIDINNVLHEVGGADDCVTVDYVSDDVDRLIAAVIESDDDITMTSTNNHEYVGYDTENFGTVVAVLLDEDGDVVCVIFKDPNTPIVVI